MVHRKQYTITYGRFGQNGKRILPVDRTFMPPRLGPIPINQNSHEHSRSPRHNPYNEHIVKSTPAYSISAAIFRTPTSSLRSHSHSNPTPIPSQPLQLRSSTPASAAMATPNVLRDSKPRPVVGTTHYEMRPQVVRSKHEINRSPLGEAQSLVSSREIPSTSKWVATSTTRKLLSPMTRNTADRADYSINSRSVSIYLSRREDKENRSALGNNNFYHPRRSSALGPTSIDTSREGRQQTRGRSLWETAAPSSSSSGTSEISSGTVGLVNLGNTCFMNAALQCIAHTSSVASHFLSNHFSEANTNDDKLASSFVEVVRGIYRSVTGSRKNHRMSASKGLAFRPQKFLEDLTDMAPQFDGGKQHDCHEFIRVLIDTLCEDMCTSDKNQLNLPSVDLDNMSFIQAANYSWKQHLSKNSSFITDEFCGQLVSTLECSNCGSKRYTFEPFYDLSVPFPTAESSPDEHGRSNNRYSFLHRTNNHACTSCNLGDCLRTFTEPEILADPIECSTCRQRQESTKRLQVYRFPRVLVIHLKRFGNDRKKIVTSVEFPVNGLDVSILAIDNENKPVTPLYDLFAVCEHSGSMSFGHYTATCKDPFSGQWKKYNDSNVSTADPEDDTDNKAAYVLFYKHRI